MFSAGAFSALPLSTTFGSVYGGVVGEGASVAEQTSYVQIGFGVFINEGATASKSAFLINNTFNPVISEGVTALDSKFSTGAFTASVVEAARAVTIRQVGGGFASGAFASGPYSALGDLTFEISADVLTTNIIGFQTMDEGAILIDTPTNTGVLPASVVQNADMIDENGMFLTVNRSVAEAAGGDDVVSSIPEYSGRVEEAAEGVDETSSLVVFASDISELATAVELLTTQMTVNALLFNNVTVQDVLTAQAIFPARVVDIVTQTDIVSARAQWEPINTFEIADWALVNTFKPV